MKLFLKKNDCVKTVDKILIDYVTWENMTNYITHLLKLV